MKTVMFVDDEKLVLRSLKSIFSDEDNNYVYFTNGVDALAYMEENSVDLLCSDILMPAMNGFELFRIVRDKYPETVRIAISSFSQKKLIDRILKENLASMFLFKPWNGLEVKTNIENILDMKTTLMNRDLIEFISKIDKLPSIPELYYELIALVREEKDMEEIASLIETDQAITSSILRVANSAFYGRKTGSIVQAIMNIGLNNLKNIVITNSVFEGSDLEMQGVLKLWKHTMYTNKFTCGIYTECLNKTIPSIFASAGLLHDIGKVILYHHDTAKYSEILKRSNEEKVTVSSLEKELFGVTHQDLGAYLLDWWELPFAYVEAAMHHHRPLDRRVVNSELLSVIHIANFYSNKFFMNGDENLLLDEAAFEKLNITKKEVEIVIDRLKK